MGQLWQGHNSERTWQVNLQWVDEFIENVRPYIFVRTEDNLLIKRPNNAVRLNATGAKMLKFLLDGRSITEILRRVDGQVKKQKEIEDFFFAVKAHLEDRIDELFPPPGVEVIPFEMRFSKYPVLSELALTYRCNLRCEFCYAGCNCTRGPVEVKREMSQEEVEAVLSKLYLEAKVPSVSFTGGEPTLIPELCEYISYAKNLGMRVNLITNGVLINSQYAEKLRKSGLDSAQISLEGVSPETHNRIVGASVFYRTVAAVENLKSAGIRTHTNTTINRENLREIVQFPCFVKEVLENERFSMNLMIPTGSGALDRSLVVHYKEVGEYVEELVKESEAQGVEFMWYSPVPMCIFNSIVHGLGNKGCSACDGLISIAPNGDVLPCASYDDSVGKFLEEDFASLWQAATTVQYRNKGFAHPLCQRCEHFAICNGACPLYWRQLGYDELLSTQSIS